MSKKIKILYCDRVGSCKTVEVLNSKIDLQNLLNGSIDTVDLGDGLLLMYGDDPELGKDGINIILTDMEGNISSSLKGSLLLVGIDGINSEYTSVPTKVINKYSNMFTKGSCIVVADW